MFLRRIEFVEQTRNLKMYTDVHFLMMPSVAASLTDEFAVRQTSQIVCRFSNVTKRRNATVSKVQTLETVAF